MTRSQRSGLISANSGFEEGRQFGPFLAPHGGIAVFEFEPPAQVGRAFEQIPVAESFLVVGHPPTWLRAASPPLPAAVPNSR